MSGLEVTMCAHCDEAIWRGYWSYSDPEGGWQHHTLITGKTEAEYGHQAEPREVSEGWELSNFRTALHWLDEAQRKKHS